MSTPSLITLRIAAALTAISATAVVVQLAARERTPPVRCPPGLTLERGRCCGGGQVKSGDRCEGMPKSCGPRQTRAEAEGEPPGCVITRRRVRVAGARLPLGAADWQLAHTNQPVDVSSFVIDIAEVTVARYLDCVNAGSCPKLARTRELGLPVRGVSPATAEAFCRYAGGRLPTSAEWRLAAGGREGRRFPWGSTGLVCRRAAFGLVSGPCGTDGDGPDLAGARPPGATPEGLLDMAGNVAEWARDPNGRYRARGGSYKSRVAVELVTASVETASDTAEHVGFRCAY